MPVLRLFPLNTVVFPGQQLPLHIFEPRYRQLVQEVMAEDAEFGIALIRRGQVAGGGAVPADVGCAVRIIQAEELPDGRFNIACQGTRRFRVRELLGEDPFLRAEVDFQPVPDDADDDATAALAQKISAQFTDHLRLTLALQDGWQRSFRLPSRPAVLADYVAGRVDAGLQPRQEVLQADRVALRLELLAKILRSENSQLAERLVLQRRQKLGGLGVLN